MGRLKNVIEAKNGKNCGLAKDDTGLERWAVGTGSGKCEVVQGEDWFCWVVEDKNRCRMVRVNDERCVICDSCGEFERDRRSC